jgi:hypothetical protein
MIVSYKLKKDKSNFRKILKDFSRSAFKPSSACEILIFDHPLKTLVRVAIFAVFPPISKFYFIRQIQKTVWISSVK